ncbi:hypothetical protein FACUT_7651 [Fusarium acutatum]|uniref:F-box domain-containing protein n=1 Tax=Fusarium acutatum TaxID=78861 RepID=A0A8H4JN40_9HYPO|nr:hypothetical protein FACUT_7651 [Fusarium acutatum]
MTELEPTASWLPDEVLFNILSMLQDSDDPDAISTKEANITLFNACLTSRRLESLAQKVLYRCIDARSSKCLLTLGQNPHLCRLVRELYCPYDTEVVNALLHPHFRHYIWLPSSWSVRFPGWLESELGRQEYYDQATAFWLQRLPNLNRLTISLNYEMQALTEMVQKSLNRQPRRFPPLTRIDFKLSPSGIPACIQPSLILLKLPFLKTVTIDDMSFARANNGDLEMPKNACKRLERLDADFSWITPGSLRNMLSVCESLRCLDIKVRTMLSTKCDPFNYRFGDWIQHCHALESLVIQIKASRRWTDRSTGGREVQEHTWAANNIGSLQSLTRLKRFSFSVELHHLTMPPGPSVPTPSPSKLDFELMLPTSIEQFEIRKIGIPDYKAFVRNIVELLQSKRLKNLYHVSVAANLRPHHLAQPSWEVRWRGSGQSNKVIHLMHEDRKKRVRSSYYE